MTEEWPMKRVPFKIEKNPNGTYAIIENPYDYRFIGSLPWYKEMVVRSPFDTEQKARERMKEIGSHWEYEPYEVE